MVVRINGAVVQRAGGSVSNGEVHSTGLPNIRVNGFPIAVEGQFSTGNFDVPLPAKALTRTVRAQTLPIIKFGDPYSNDVIGTNDAFATDDPFATPVGP